MSGIPPAITPENRGFWEGAARGQLVVEYCRECATHIFPPRGFCAGCGNRTLTEATIDGDGFVYSFTVNWNAWQPGMQVPFALALVEFPQAPGVRILGRLHGAPHDGIRIGQTVGVGFDEGPAGIPVPAFVWKGDRP